MSLSKQELDTVLRCVDKVFDFRAERDRLRDLLATLEAENKGLAARVAELERELEQAKADRARAAMDARNPLMAQLAALESRCKRLEEAGDAHMEWVPASFQGAWRAAKEAKP